MTTTPTPTVDGLAYQLILDLRAYFRKQKLATCGPEASKLFTRLLDYDPPAPSEPTDTQMLDWLERIDHQKNLFGNWIGGGETLRTAIRQAMLAEATDKPQ